MADNTYTVQYSTTGRASCKLKACGQIIKQGEVRIGKCLPNFFDMDGDSVQLQWHHPECWFQRQSRMRASSKKVMDEEDLEGFQDLSESDKNWMRDLIGGRRAPKPKAKAPVPAAAAARPARPTARAAAQVQQAPVQTYTQPPPAAAAPRGSDALSGCVIAFCGNLFGDTMTPVRELKRLTKQHSGKVSCNVTAKTTHMIVGHDWIDWMVQAANKHNTNVVVVDWIHKSVAAGVAVSEVKFRCPLPDLTPSAGPNSCFGVDASVDGEVEAVTALETSAQGKLIPSEQFSGVLLTSDHVQTIGNLCGNIGLPYSTGDGFYELCKTEKVNESKKLIALTSGGDAIVGARNVRELLGLGYDTRGVAPTHVPDGYRLFVNSTSANRNLKAGQGAIVELMRGAAMPSTGFPVVAGGSLVAATPPPVTKKTLPTLPASVPCAGCGQTSRGNDKFCGRCGASLHPEERPSSSVIDDSATLVLGDELQGEQEVGVFSWETVDDSLLVCNAAAPPNTRVACFDMDGTIITTASGRVMPKDVHDWKLLLPEIPTKLRELVDGGFKIVFFTNQAGVRGDANKRTNIKQKIEDVATACGVDVQVLVATKKDRYRKPSSGMWDHFCGHCNGGVEVDMSTSLFVGDAAGRPQGWKKGRKKDFSASDRKFALNIGLPFYTPEEHFLGEAPAPFSFDGCDPRTLPRSGAVASSDGGPIPAPHQEMVIMVGCPASGKTTFVKRNLVPAGYVHVNRDSLNTKTRCLKAAKAALAGGCSVVIDNTNPSASVRAEYIQLAGDVPVRAFVLQTPIETAHHCNLFRNKQTNGGIAVIPRIAYNVFQKNYVPPDLAEGFTAIKKINFVVDFQGDAAAETLFNHFT